MVVPFLGAAAEREALRARLEGLALAEGDSLVVVDNTPGAAAPGGRVPVLAAPERTTPGYARNRGAEQGRGEWLVFVDADVVAPPDLVERYFETPPAADTGVLAGAVADEPVGPGAPAAARYAQLERRMNQENTLGWGRWAFAQTANAAFRREAFEQVGGFREDIRAAEDADLGYRLAAAGWGLERREAARALHVSRTSVPALLRQRMVHGAGGAWLDRHYPGSVARKRWPGFLWWMARFAVTGLARAARARDADQALVAVLAPLDNLAYELGRSRDNHRP